MIAAGLCAGLGTQTLRLAHVQLHLNSSLGQEDNLGKAFSSGTGAALAGRWSFSGAKWEHRHADENLVPKADHSYLEAFT